MKPAEEPVLILDATRHDVGYLPKPTMANVCRYQPAVGYTEANKKYTKVETHVRNKPYAICKAMKNSLEGMSNWPPKTYFTIEIVK